MNKYIVTVVVLVALCTSHCMTHPSVFSHGHRLLHAEEGGVIDPAPIPASPSVPGSSPAYHRPNKERRIPLFTLTETRCELDCGDERYRCFLRQSADLRPQVDDVIKDRGVCDALVRKCRRRCGQTA